MDFGTLPGDLDLDRPQELICPVTGHQDLLPRPGELPDVSGVRARGLTELG